MATHTAFFYGTLMVPKILHRVIYGSTTPLPHQTQFLTISPALLPGFTRHRVLHADYPGITPAAASAGPPSAGPSVLGTYVTGLTPQDLVRLDFFEGSEYERREVTVRVLGGSGSVAEVQREAVRGGGLTEGEGQGEMVATQTYVFLERKGLEEREWDFEEFKREKMAAWTLEDSEEYHDIPYDEGEGAKERDGTGGRGVGGEITKGLQEEYEMKGKGQGTGEAESVARAAV